MTDPELQQPSNMKKRILLLVEDDSNFAQWARIELQRDCPDLTLVLHDSLPSARQWLLTADAHALSMAVVDLHLGECSGVDLIEQLHQSHPDVPLLVLTSVDTPAEALMAIRAGAQGYVLKNTVQQELSRAVEQLRAGGSPINPSIAYLLLDVFRDHKQTTEAGDAPTQEAVDAISHRGLSQRETDVLKLVSRGYTDKEVAARLGISPSTVDTHVRSIFRKFSVHSRAELRRVIGG